MRRCKMGKLGDARRRNVSLFGSVFARPLLAYARCFNFKLTEAHLAIFRWITRNPKAGSVPVELLAAARGVPGTHP